MAEIHCYIPEGTVPNCKTCVFNIDHEWDPVKKDCVEKEVKSDGS